MIAFFVQGEPKGQPRPRAFSRGGRASVYNPSTAEGWKSQIAIAAKPFIPDVPIEGPICVDLIFYFPRPRSHYRTGKHSGLLREDSPVYHTIKPDRDNSDKAVLDALSVLRFWNDDAQVCDGRIKKRYASSQPGPGCSIVIYQADGFSKPGSDLPLQTLVKRDS